MSFFGAVEIGCGMYLNVYWMFIGLELWIPSIATLIIILAILIYIDLILKSNHTLSNLWRKSFADALQNRCYEKFRKFHRKLPVLESLFNKVAGLQVCNVIKKRLQQKCVLVKFTKLLRTPFLQNTSGRLLPLFAVSFWEIFSSMFV